MMIVHGIGTLIRIVLFPVCFVVQLALAFLKGACAACCSLAEAIGTIVGAIFVTCSIIGVIAGIIPGNMFWMMFLCGVGLMVLPGFMEAIGFACIDFVSWLVIRISLIDFSPSQSAPVTECHR